MSKKKQENLRSSILPSKPCSSKNVKEPSKETPEIPATKMMDETEYNKKPELLTTLKKPNTKISGVPGQPNQPTNFHFPARSFGAKNPENRSFQAQWFKRFQWLHYDQENDMVFCHTCQRAIQNNLLSSSKADRAFTHTGFCNWKHAIDKSKGFAKHEMCDSHVEAVQRYVLIPATSGDVGELISSQHSLEKLKNRKMLLLILSSIRYLARQGLPLRGVWNKDTSSEENSNFYQLLRLRADENTELSNWLKQDTNYTSPVIQNEILETLAQRILNDMSHKIQKAVFYTIMADETTDVSNKEQLVICIRLVDESFLVHEDFVGMYPLERTTADHIIDVLQNTLKEMGLDIQNARGQCYDGAATMSGIKTGVATQIKSLNSKCLYTHCYGHALNLAVADAIKSIKCVSDSLDTVREVGKLVKKSPQRNAKLDKIRADTENDAKSVHTLCPTRWTVRGEALAAALNNHAELMELWDWSLDVVKETEMKARIQGVQSMMKTFSFFFGCSLGEILLRQTDNLSRSLQDSSTTAAQGNRLARVVVATLQKDRNDASFGMFWERILRRKNLEIPEIEEPIIPRKRKAPARYEVGNKATHYFPSTSKEYYKSIYFTAIDTVTQCITARFDQEDSKIYVQVQELLLKSFAGESNDEELDAVVKTYGNDLDRFNLDGQLRLLPQLAEAMGFDTKKFYLNDLISLFQSLDSSQKHLLGDVCTLGKVLLVMPATNAVSERSLSALKRVKTYLKSTTGEDRLKHLMVVHVHKDQADSLSMIHIANDFVDKKESRRQIFGTFTSRDVEPPLQLMSKFTQTEC